MAGSTKKFHEISIQMLPFTIVIYARALSFRMQRVRAHTHARPGDGRAAMPKRLRRGQFSATSKFPHLFYSPRLSRRAFVSDFAIIGPSVPGSGT